MPSAVEVAGKCVHPFGSMLPNSWGSAGSYRYGFNGKEMDDEVKGQGLQYDYGFRIYDPRLGKFLSTDPLFKSYPWYTPYQFAGNKPIESIDLDGLEEIHYSIIVDRENGIATLEYSHQTDIIDKVLIVDRKATQWMDPGEYHYEKRINQRQAIVFDIYDPSYGKFREKRKLFTNDYIQKNLKNISAKAKDDPYGATGEFYAFAASLDGYDYEATMSAKFELSNTRKDEMDTDFYLTILSELPILKMLKLKVSDKISSIAAGVQKKL